MQPITFPESNFTFNKPSDMTDDQCGSLPVVRCNTSDGTPLIISCWELSEEDKAKITETGHIWLTICGTGMPPVSLQSEKPFES
jgi:hypothetical protein